MAPRFHHQRRAHFDRFRSALLRLDRMLTARRSVRSAFDTCPNTAQRFAKNPVLCFVPRESFRNFLRSYQVTVGRRDENCLLRLFKLVSIPRSRLIITNTVAFCRSSYVSCSVINRAGRGSEARSVQVRELESGRRAQRQNSSPSIARPPG